VLAIDGVSTAGLSVEQVEQLSRIEPESESEPRHVTVLRENASTAIELTLPNRAGEQLEIPPLESKLVSYGAGHALVIKIEDVADDLGQELAQAISVAKASREPLGILLDLRGNGGGSTDGAQAALGLFLPGAPSFPLLHRGHVQEILRALEPEANARWTGPVAVLVDGETASAAEMIAGAIVAYGRGEILGRHTFGKGCIQEYFEDPAATGVLRLTTLLVALPNGAPLQRTGIEPTLRLPLPEPSETERDLHAAPQAASGPDIRDLHAIGGAEWPFHSGKVGPCTDKVVCLALSRLGQRPSALRRSRNAQNSPAVRAHRARSPRPVLGQAEHSVHGTVQSRSGRGPAISR
jgi:carboxyl-terminal processing protease